MGCTCKLQLGNIPEADYSQVFLKITEEKYQSEKASQSNLTPKDSPCKAEEISTLKPNFLYSPSDLKSHSPDISKIDFSLTMRAHGNIIQEGELKKYRPGFTNQYVSRWCVLTSEYFMYFKNRRSAQIWEQLPLYSVATSNILNVSKVSFKVPGSKETSYQIEIFLKIEDDSVVVSRDTDKTPILRSLIEKTSVQDQKDSVVKGMLMKRPVRLTSPEKNIGEIVPVTAERMSWSIREVEWFSAEKRLLFITENALERDFWILNILKACESIHND